MAAVKPSDFTQLDKMRHSAAHLLAAAVTRLFPDVKLGVGPVVENGFYYDMLLPRPLTTEDFANIEKEIEKLKQENVEFRREEMPIDAAIEFFKQRNQDFKVDLLSSLKTRGTTAVVSDDEAGEVEVGASQASVFWTGDFVDLCRGPHVDKSGQVGAVKIKSVAGAYWRGKEGNPQLQRVYGYAFATREELDNHLKLIEEAEKRDHRKLGKELGLFVFSDLVGPGLPLWTPKGTLLRDELDQFVWRLRKERGFMRVTIPHITKKELYEKSGHWAKYADDLFKIETREGHTFAMKPMNCPHHTQIYDSELHSYRELPLRYAETTMVYRDEQSGELAGLTRVLSITQDDAHIFCRLSQAREEAEKIWDIISTFYGAFGFELSLRLSRRDPAHPEKYMGEPADWDRAEAELKGIIESRTKEYADGPGEAAFYGPKIDFMAKDSLGRTHQVATIQLDFNQPRNFGLTCVNEKGEREPIMMIHCAIMGSIERFTAVLIEHLGGAFPMWLSPLQVRFAPVSQDHVVFATSLMQKLRDAGLRVDLDDSDEKVGKKIRNAAMQKIPWTIVIGGKDAEGGDLQVNVFGQEERLVIPQAELVARALEAAKRPA